MSESAENFAEEVYSQDEPPVDAIEREQRAEKSAPAYLDLSASELNSLATKEWREQDALRGPIIVPEWGNAGIFCRRLSYMEQKELISVFNEHGIIGAFCFRALNASGDRIFPSMKLFIKDMSTRWNPQIIERVVGDMSALCRTQLTDKELGKS